MNEPLRSTQAIPQTKRRVSGRLCLVAIFSFILVFCLTAKPQNQPVPTPVQEPTVRLQINVVDGDGRAVTDLRAEDIQILDGGVPETISLFSRDARPLLYGLVIDGTGSLEPQFRSVLGAAGQIVAANQAEDQTFIIKFVSSENITTLQELTSDKNALTNALIGIKPELGQTALIDGLYLAAQYVMKTQESAVNRAPAIVLVSDGEERASYYRESDLFKLLGKTNLQIFTIGLVGELKDGRGLVRKSPRQSATDLITKLARETQGRAFMLQSASELPDAVEKLIQMLHVRYLVEYRPTRNPEKLRRDVDVKLAAPEHKNWKATAKQISAAKK
jgi:VWFA-related protein